MRVESDQPQMIRSWTLWVILGFFICGFAVLIGRLWSVQIRDNPEYSGAQLAQSYRRVQTPGMRGRILDRNGVVLAYNRPAYSVAIYCEELRRPGRWANTIAAVDACVTQLSVRLGIPRQVTMKDVERHVLKNLPMPFIVFQDVDFTTVAKLSENFDEFPGVVVMPVPRRVYPHGALAAHVIGSVGFFATDPEPNGVRWHFRLPEPRGRSGIEARYDDLLSGMSGEAVLRVDSRGYAHERWVKQKERSGRDLMLTLDVKLQQVAEAALAHRPGAVVALDPRNGDLLVLASAPTYDLNEMVPPVSSTYYRGLLDNEEKPLFNRAIQGTYPPGSVFKPFTAIAAQENNFNADTLYNCDGIYTDYNCRLRCANHYGHGELDLRQAIMKSCNPYFCAMGTQVGIEAISATAEQAGFGVKTGIDLPGEAKGIMPTPEWKLRSQKARWTPADTAQCSIGQGMILVTPLQVAHAIGSLAEGGATYRPRLVAFGNHQGELQRRLSWSHDAIRAVIDGMELVVSSGTGRTMQVEGVAVAGKTGTAEYIDSQRVRRKRVWCAAFAPADHPEIVVVGLLDNGAGGGKDVGPIIQKVLSAYFNAKAIPLIASPETLED
ncbi:MAG: penicillin-binding protein 2 [Kiritimatiellia bacterium]